MITAVTYNCAPDSLDDVSEAAFAEAFENEVRVNPKFRECSVLVTFDNESSGVTGFAADDAADDMRHDDELRAEFQRLADKAFTHLIR